MKCMQQRKETQNSFNKTKAAKNFTCSLKSLVKLYNLTKKPL